MQFHLLAPPNAMTTAAFDLCGFTQMTRRFASLMKRLGHTVILYGGEENDVDVDLSVPCISKAEQASCIAGQPYQSVDYDLRAPLFQTFNAKAAAIIGTLKHSHDILATITGTASIPVATQHPDLRFLEYSIGYKGVCAPYRVYQSEAWRHCVHGFTGVDGGRDFDAVIPPFFEASEFPLTVKPEPYVLYCGRVVARKGLVTCCRAAEAAGVQLLVCGFGDPKLVTYGHFLGSVPTAQRNQLMSRAQAVMMPTQYIEPFGNVAAEAQLCGTPVISTDYGAFTESIEQGQSGFRCNTLGEFVQAIKVARMLDRPAIQARAQSLYSMEAAAVSYTRYFDRLSLIHGEGWESLDPGAFALADPAELESSIPVPTRAPARKRKPHHV